MESDSSDDRAQQRSELDSTRSVVALLMQKLAASSCSYCRSTLHKDPSSVSCRNSHHHECFNLIKVADASNVGNLKYIYLVEKDYTLAMLELTQLRALKSRLSEIFREEDFP